MGNEMKSYEEYVQAFQQLSKTANDCCVTFDNASNAFSNISRVINEAYNLAQEQALNSSKNEMKIQEGNQKMKSKLGSYKGCSVFEYDDFNDMIAHVDVNGILKVKNNSMLYICEDYKLLYVGNLYSTGDVVIQDRVHWRVILTFKKEYYNNKKVIECKDENVYKEIKDAYLLKGNILYSIGTKDIVARVVGGKYISVGYDKPKVVEDKSNECALKKNIEVPVGIEVKIKDIDYNIFDLDTFLKKNTVKLDEALKFY